MNLRRRTFDSFAVGPRLLSLTAVYAVLMATPTLAQPGGALRGIVVSDATGAPLDGAIVNVDGMSQSTTT